MPQDEQDKEDPDKYLVYPEIDDVYQITKDKSINQSGKSKELCVLNIEPHSKFSVNQIIKKDWKLENKKDYPLQSVLDIVKAGKLPNQEDRKQLPPLTNSYEGMKITVIRNLDPKMLKGLNAQNECPNFVCTVEHTDTRNFSICRLF